MKKCQSYWTMSYHEVQLQTIPTLQQFIKMSYSLVQASPNNLLTYFTMF